MEHPIITRAKAIAKRTAQHGLDEAALSDQDKAKWFLIWTCDIVGELGEAIETSNSSACTTEDLMTEVGDILWGIGAVSLLFPQLLVLDVNIKLNALGFHSAKRNVNILLSALALLEVAKKTARDGLEVRPLDHARVSKDLSQVFSYLLELFGREDLDWSLDLVDAKLKARYPNGFTPQASVNRTV